MSFPGRFTDHLIPDQLHKISVSFLVDSMKRQRGGIAANIAYTVALLGGRPCVMATVGQDFGEYRTWLEAHGVDTSAVVVIPDEYCASFFVNTDRQQNQIGHFYAGAMAHAAELSFTVNAPDAGLTIISPNAPDAMRSYVTECKALGIPYIYDPSQQTIRLSGEELCYGIDGAYLLAVNEYELGMIAEKTALDEAAVRRMARRVLITRGAAGSDFWVDGETYHIPAVPPHQVVEPTGAGDAFRGGLLRGIQLGLPWDVVGRMGALAATYVLEQMGTQNHTYTREEFISRYREHFDDEGALDALLD
jgi:adenosine kinase